MTYEDFNEFCGSLPAATHVIQWRKSHVWKVGNKVFAIGRWNKGKNSGITFKASEISYEVLKAEPGLRPAPYFASRGMKWIQHHANLGLSDDDLKSYLTASYRMVCRGLTKKKQKELGLKP